MYLNNTCEMNTVRCFSIKESVHILKILKILKILIENEILQIFKGGVMIATNYLKTTKTI